MYRSYAIVERHIEKIIYMRTEVPAHKVYLHSGKKSHASFIFRFHTLHCLHVMRDVYAQHIAGRVHAERRMGCDSPDFESRFAGGFGDGGYRSASVAKFGMGMKIISVCTSGNVCYWLYIHFNQVR